MSHAGSNNMDSVHGSFLNNVRWAEKFNSWWAVSTEGDDDAKHKFFRGQWIAENDHERGL